MTRVNWPYHISDIYFGQQYTLRHNEGRREEGDVMMDSGMMIELEVGGKFDWPEVTSSETRRPCFSQFFPESWILLTIKGL